MAGQPIQRMFDLRYVPKDTFSEAEMSLVNAGDLGDLTEEERGRRALLLVRMYDTTDYYGAPRRTSLVFINGEAAARNALIRVVAQVADGYTKFEGENGFWNFLYAYVSQIVDKARDFNRITDRAVRIWELFGGAPQDWSGIELIPQNYERIAVRFLQIQNPGVLNLVPPYVLRTLGLELDLDYVPGPEPASDERAAADNAALRQQISKLQQAIDKQTEVLRRLGRQPAERPPREPSAKPPPPPPSGPVFKDLEHYEPVAPPTPPPTPPAPPPPPQVPLTPPPQVPLTPIPQAPPGPTPPSGPPPLEELTAEVLRPKYLDDFATWPTIVQQLKADVRSRNFSRCYLFLGPAGIGKTSLAFAVPRTYLRLEGQRRGQPDLGAPNTSIQSEGVSVFSPDDMAAGQTDLVRTRIKNAISTRPMEGGMGLHRFVILDDVAKLSPEAQDALNRVLETYSGASTIIMTANLLDPNQLRPGLKSRCAARTYLMSRVSPEGIEATLLNVARKYNLTSPNLAEIAHRDAVRAEGDLRIGLDLFLSDLREEKFG